ncbi:50S ribosomal protein L22 [Metallosphaera sp. J1]|uniref:50S ribosomal protein L22 n=1 Tax=Metallosphaera TaxID=41980 RepID=UPI001EDDEDEC|nr:50S ribosomal protein L22 [Metallosphaera javensis (ex Hofmann et al. 2022)]MCG3107771.1 50S ribosomal protein L22 [Metallosphaera javensis (ex Hofmann et al. 2022)]BCS92078.1 MAG: 50S ribosomal protein L22 [Metallosphaera javensis (ex Sakai et al. 2022)]
MASWNYPILSLDDSRTGKAVVRNAPVSIKDLYNVCKAIRGMNVKEAQAFLQRVIEEKEALPYWRYSHGASHKSNISKKWKVKSGRYPKKAIKYVIKALENAMANAQGKGLDEDKLKIVHIAAHKGIIIKRFLPRAFGRATKKYNRTSHIEVIVGEV